jgi:hypothetical protein
MSLFGGAWRITVQEASHVLKLLTRTSIVLAMLPASASAQSALPIEGVHRTVHDEQSPAPAEERKTTADARASSSMLGDPFGVSKLAFTPVAQQTVRQRKDSLWNGVIVGAGLGALVGIAGSPLISDCSECAGFNVPLTFGVLGAGIGAAVGAGIDAMRNTNAPHRPHVQLAPVLSKDTRGLLALIRF